MAAEDGAALGGAAEREPAWGGAAGGVTAMGGATEGGGRRVAHVDEGAGDAGGGGIHAQTHQDLAPLLLAQVRTHGHLDANKMCSL